MWQPPISSLSNTFLSEWMNGSLKCWVCIVFESCLVLLVLSSLTVRGFAHLFLEAKRTAGGYYKLGHTPSSELMRTRRCWPRCAGSTIATLKHPHTSGVAFTLQVVLLSVFLESLHVSFLWHWGSLRWAGPCVRSLRLLLALISRICWRWADVLVVEKFIHSLILYTRFLLRSRLQGVCQGRCRCRLSLGEDGLHARQDGSSSQRLNSHSTLTLTAHFVFHVCVFLDCTTDQERLKKTQTEEKKQIWERPLGSKPIERKCKNETTFNPQTFPANF